MARDFIKELKELWNIPEPSARARLSQYRIVNISSHFAFPDEREGRRLMATEPFSPDTVNWERRVYTLLASFSYLNDDAQPFVRNRYRVVSPSSGQIEKTAFFRMARAEYEQAVKCAKPGFMSKLSVSSTTTVIGRGD